MTDALARPTSLLVLGGTSEIAESITPVVPAGVRVLGLPSMMVW